VVVNFKLSSDRVIVGKHVRKPETETCQCYRIVESSTGISLATCEGLIFRGFLPSVLTQTPRSVHTVCVFLMFVTTQRLTYFTAITDWLFEWKHTAFSVRYELSICTALAF
jgi:hypothetical protein